LLHVRSFYCRLSFSAVQTRFCSRRADVFFQGTVIRVFSVPDGQKLFEFRRGVKRCVLGLDICRLLLQASVAAEL